MSKLLTLEEWAKAKYANPPKLRTLRLWAREARIVPVPQKHGRTYFVQADAHYVDWSLDGSTEAQRA